MARFAFASAIVLVSAICSAASLTGVGAGNLTLGISADGSTVIGVSRDWANEAFRWTATTGVQNLGRLPGDVASVPVAISANGLVVAGRSNHFTLDQDNDPIDNYRGFYWTPAGGMVDLGLLANSSQTYVTAMSADGSVVFGHSVFENSHHAFRWTPATGIQPLDDPTSPVSSEISAVSADGSVAAGIRGGEAIRWTASGGVTPLAGLAGNANVYASAISADGSVVVGTIFSPTSPARPFRWTASTNSSEIFDPGSTEATLLSADGQVFAGEFLSPDIEAFRWTSSTGVIRLGFPPSHGADKGSDVSAISADGSIIVGAGVTDIDTAVIWDEQNGQRILKQVLAAQGVDVSDWGLHQPTGISADGATIVGYGYRVHDGSIEGWVVSIPEPASAAILLFFVSDTVFRRRRVSSILCS